MFSSLRLFFAGITLLIGTSFVQAQDEVQPVTLRHPATGFEMTAINYGARIVRFAILPPDSK